MLGPEGHTVPPFAFLDSDSVEFSQHDCAGQLRVIDFFFTTCPTICPIMSTKWPPSGRHWRRNEGRPAISRSVDPENDTPSQLKAYGERIGQDPEVWKLLTGKKEDLYDLARNGYFLTAIENDTAAGGIFRSDIFAVVDRERIRWYYDSTNTEEVDQLLEAVEQLWALSE